MMRGWPANGKYQKNCSEEIKIDINIICMHIRKYELKYVIYREKETYMYSECERKE